MTVKQGQQAWRGDFLDVRAGEEIIYNHWTPREVPISHFFITSYQYMICKYFLFILLMVSMLYRRFLV